MGKVAPVATVEPVRQEWEEADRRLEQEARSGADPLHTQVEAVTEELRKRIGQTFTLAEGCACLRGRRPLGPRGRRRARAVPELAAEPGARRGCRLPPVCPRRRRLQALSTRPGRPSRQARRRRARRHRAVRLALGLALGLVVFGLGVALGEALHDNPKPGGRQTVVRTLRPGRFHRRR